MANNFLEYNPPGPVAAKFLADRSAVSGILGPMGSGKTGVCLMKCAAIAQETPPSKITGERLFKWGVIRNTFADLKRTTMKSMENWFGSAGHWGGGGSSMEPPFFKISFMKDGIITRLWFDFVGLDSHNIEQLAKGWEISAYWMNEADLMPRDVFDMVDGRSGRYPGAMHCELPWYGGIADYNAPDTENWLYELFEVEKPRGYTLFRQPSGTSPHAENLENLPKNYYDRMMIGKQDWWIRRNVHAQYGYSRDGKPVYEEYSDDFHCASRELMPTPGIVVYADFDQGLRPACVLRQHQPNGQVRILDELYCERGAKGICAMLKQLMGSAKYKNIRIIGGKCDPAGMSPDTDEGEMSWIDMVNGHMGWTGHDRVSATDTNSIEHRTSAVVNRLKTNVDDAQPGLLISSTCVVLRKAFNSHYRFKRQRISGSAEYSDKPEKNFPYADVSEALQYGCLDNGGYEEVVGRERRRKNFNSYKTHQAKMAVRV